MSKVYRFRLIQRVVRKLFSRINFRVLSLNKKESISSSLLVLCIQPVKNVGKSRATGNMVIFIRWTWLAELTGSVHVYDWMREIRWLFAECSIPVKCAFAKKKKYRIKLPFQKLQHMLHRHYAFDRSPDNERTEYSVEGRHLHTLHSFLQACKNSRNI